MTHGDARIEAELDRLLSVEALRQLNDLYVELIDNGRLDEFAQLFRNGAWKGLFGAAAVRNWLEEHVIIYGSTPKTHHLVSSLRIVVDGDTGVGRSVITVLQQHPTSGVVSVITVNDYVDKYSRHNGSWSFVSRDVVRRLPSDMSLHVR